MLGFFMKILLILGLMLGGFQNPASAAEKAGTVTVVNGTEMVQPETKVTYGEKETALSALLKSVGESNVITEDTSFGKMITSIKGVKAKDASYWGYFINGISAQVGADAYNVQDGDRLTFSYINGAEASDKKVSLKILGKDNKVLKEWKDVAFINEANAFQLVQVAAGTDKVTYEESDYGKMITSLEGQAAEGSTYWGFYVNDKMGEVGADSYKLQPGDAVSFKLEEMEATPETSETEAKAEPVTNESIKQSVDEASKYVLSHKVGEWEAIALKQAGKEVPKSYLDDVKKGLKDKQGKLERITDYERYVLGIVAAGGDPTKVEGYNLVENIYNGDVEKQGLNGVAYGLLALNSGQFEIPENAKWTKEKLLDELLKKQNADGGWAWDGSTTSDLDSTGMVLAALAPYKKKDDVAAKINSAVDFLASQYSAGKIDNSSTASQTVIALSALKIDANSKEFTKDGTSLISYLLSFQNADGGFDWQGGEASDEFSTAQGLQGVVAYQQKDKGSLYQFAESATKSESKSEEFESKYLIGFVLVILLAIFTYYLLRRKKSTR